MPEGKAGNYWDLERKKPIGEDLDECLPVFLRLPGLGVGAILVDADSDTSDLLQHARVQPTA
jgi:hypothetical protein